MSSSGERLLKSTRDIVKTHILQISYEACLTVTATLGDTSGMLVAAIYANNKLNQTSSVKTHIYLVKHPFVYTHTYHFILDITITLNINVSAH